MKLIRKAAGQDLQWIRPKGFKRAFELHSADEVLALLYSQKGTNRMIGEAADGRWVFKRRSIWRNSDIVITEVASQAEIAVVKWVVSGKLLKRRRTRSLAFSDGRLLTFQKTSYGRNEWVWLNEQGTPLIHFLPGNHLKFEPSALSLPELSLLVIVGWHLMVLQQEDDAAQALFMPPLG